jgi:hypothetical protein
VIRECFKSQRSLLEICPSAAHSGVALEGDSHDSISIELSSSVDETTVAEIRNRALERTGFCWERHVASSVLTNCAAPGASSSWSAFLWNWARRCNEVFQGQPIKELHSYQWMPVVLVDVVNRADVGVIQRRSGLSLSLKACERLAVVGKVFGQELKRDETMQASVLGLVNDAHPTPSFSNTR